MASVLYLEAFEQPQPVPHVSETSLSHLVLLLKGLDSTNMGQGFQGRVRGSRSSRVVLWVLEGLVQDSRGSGFKVRVLGFRVWVLGFGCRFRGSEIWVLRFVF